MASERIEWSTCQDHDALLRIGVRALGGIPVEIRPIWVGDILDAMLPLFEGSFAHRAALRLIATSRNRSLWTTGRQLFAEIREMSLAPQCELRDDEMSFLALLEIAAKLIYNASGEKPRFDEHVGARVFLLTRVILQQSNAHKPIPEQQMRVERALWKLLECN